MLLQSGSKKMNHYTEGCDLLIFSNFSLAENQDQKIAAFGSSYRGIVHCAGDCLYHAPHD